jgi:ribonuclease D
MLTHLRGEPALAIDTESNSLYVYEEQVCLIQISVPETDYLVDPLRLADIAELGPLLADPKVLKVLHGAEYDLIGLQRDFGLTLSSLFDTMWASRILGWKAHGLAALLQMHFGVTLNKKYQRANWGVRPLPKDLIDYARLDTHYLLPLYGMQREELESRGRWPQARHRFNKLTETRWQPKVFEPDGFWRIAGIRDLDDVGRGVLRELYLFREQRARSENRPPFRVISNHALLALSEQRPQKAGSLHLIKGISRRMADRYGRGVLRAIQRGASQPIAWGERVRQRSSTARLKNGRPSPECQARFESLRLWRNATSEERGVEPDIVLTNQTLWAVAHRNPRNRGDLTRDNLLAQWQVDEYGDALLAVVKETTQL